MPHAAPDSRQAPTGRWTGADIGRAKPWLFLVCLYPILRWIWLGANAGLTANPPEFLIRSSGLWALVGLCLTLAVSPLRLLLSQPALVRVRRMLGLFAFFYAALHVLAWAYWERGWSVAGMWDDMLQRPLIAVGVAATLPLIALAWTSTSGWMRRLGRQWQRLHRLIYPAAVLSVLHFWLIRAGKNDFAEPYAYALVLGLLLAWRVVAAIRRLRQSDSEGRAGPRHR